MIHGDQLLPGCLSVGTSGGPGFSTRIRGEDTGYHIRTPVWTTTIAGAVNAAKQYDGPSRLRYRARKINLSAQDYAEVLQMFWTCRGQGYGFRFRDPGDWSTHPENDKLPNYLDLAHYTPLRVQIGTERRYQLCKTYSETSVEGGAFVRCITRPMRPGKDLDAVLAIFPISGPVSSKTGSPVWFYGIDFSCDFDTGEIRIRDEQPLPAPGTQIYACFTFHVAAYFNQDGLRGEMTQTNDRSSIDELLLIESPLDKDYGDGINRFGGWQNIDYNAQAEYVANQTYWLDMGDAAFQQFDNMPSGSSIVLPEVTIGERFWPSRSNPYQNPKGTRPYLANNPKGGPWVKIWNNGPNPILIVQAANGPNYGNDGANPGYHLATIDDLSAGLKPGGIAEFRCAQLWDDSGVSVEQRQSLWEAV